jgi:hypothetical protein
MVSKGLIVQLEAAAGKEDELASFLIDALPLVEDEPQTAAWFALRTGASSFAIVDAFPDEGGRQAHLECIEEDSIHVKVRQPATEAIGFPVARERALDAFYHPFAHVPVAGEWRVPSLAHP